MEWVNQIKHSGNYSDRYLNDSILIAHIHNLYL